MELNFIEAVRKIRGGSDRPSPLAELPIQYANYALWQPGVVGTRGARKAG